LDFRRAIKSAKIKRTLAHDSYLINIGSPDETLYRQSVDALVAEVQRAEMLGLNYLVMHPGAHVNSGDDPSLARVITALDEVHARTPHVKVRILIENTAGQGSCLGHRFEHLAVILKGVRESKRLGVCLDTCHMFAAGYPISSSKEYQSTMSEFRRVVGMKHLKAFHLNDSVRELGSRVDRHAHIGKGKIGVEAFRHVVTDPRFAKLPMILETPKENNMDVTNLRILRKLLRKQRSAT